MTYAVCSRMSVEYDVHSGASCDAESNCYCYFPSVLGDSFHEYADAGGHGRSKRLILFSFAPLSVRARTDLFFTTCCLPP